MQAQQQWKQIQINPLDILLDIENPRIQIPEKGTQANIRQELLRTEKIIDLANGIKQSGGLMPSDRIILIKESERYVVIEGNRRTCAVQLLLNRRLLPDDFKTKFPSPSEELSARLQQIDAVVAPSRNSAEGVITKRHTEVGIEKWTVLAKQRRIAKLLKSGMDIQAIATLYSMSDTNVLKVAKEYNLFQYICQLPSWKSWEMKHLNDPRLKINPYLRAFSLKGVKDSLGISFSEKGEVQSTLEKKSFDEAMLNIARNLLIPRSDNANKPKLNTRATGADIIESASGSNTSLKAKLSIAYAGSQLGTSAKPAPATHSRDNPQPQSGTSGFAVTTKNAKQNVFFANLQNQIADDHIVQIVSEISKINHFAHPLAATFLIRALIERVLNWCVDNYGLRRDLNARFAAITPEKKSRKEPGLDFLLDYVITNHDKIFTEPRIKSVISHWKLKKDFIDLTLHVKWVLPSAEKANSIAQEVRPTMEKILTKEILK